MAYFRADGIQYPKGPSTQMYKVSTQIPCICRLETLDVPSSLVLCILTLGIQIAQSRQYSYFRPQSRHYLHTWSPTLRLKIAPQPYITRSLGPKSFKCHLHTWTPKVCKITSKNSLKGHYFTNLWGLLNSTLRYYTLGTWSHRVRERTSLARGLCS